MKTLVCVQVAMKEEGLGFAEKLGLKEVEKLDEELGFRQFHGFYGQNLEVRLFLQGTDIRHNAEQIGLEAAAVCTTLLINRFRPKLLLNFGTAGAFTQSGFALGEVTLVEGPIRFHDRRVPLPGYFESQEGNHPVADFSNLKTVLGVKTSKLSSGSSLEMCARDEEILKSHFADLKEMEGAAIAWIADKKKVPFIALKAVTDFIDHHESIEAQFLANLALASRNVQDAAIRTLGFLDGNSGDPIWTFSNCP